MEFFGYRLEKISDAEEKELENAKAVLEKHGFRAVKQTADKSKKQESVKKATAARSKLAQDKMQNAFNLLRFTDEKITAYRLAKEAGVSQPTAKKFLEKHGI